MRRIVRSDREETSFLELLLDETLCQGTIEIPCEMVRRAGGVNKRLRAKQKYELLLRIAAENPIELEEVSACDQIDTVILRDDEQENNIAYGWQTDCYVLGKYSTLLKEAGYFEAAIDAVLAETRPLKCDDEVVRYLKQMIDHGDAYYQIDDATRPILIYTGATVCCNMFTIFAEQLGNALERRGENILYFDIKENDVREIIKFKGQHFKAIVGMQSGCFSIKMSDEVHYLHEYIYGPKYNFFFDHPIFGKPYLEFCYPDFHVLVHDQTYADFLKKYYKKDAVLLPPAGIQKDVGVQERVYDLTFIGTYGRYWQQLQWIREQERSIRFLTNRFLLIMRKHPNLTAGEAFKRTLEYYQIETTEEEFLEWMYYVRWVIYGVMHYYRHRVMKAILESGIRVDVFGDSWGDCPLRKYPNLICHPGVTVEEGLVIWKQSKMSLNVMSWHKGGFTERMAGIMLAGAVLVTDDTRYLHGRYDENDMIIFDLEHLDELPQKIRRVLLDDDLREKMAENGKRKTEKDHTWDKRAEQFLELIQ